MNLQEPDVGDRAGGGFSSAWDGRLSAPLRTIKTSHRQQHHRPTREPFEACGEPS